MHAKPVLYAEDDDNDAFLMQRAFQDAKIIAPLHIVTDGQQAIDYLAGNGPYANRNQYPLPAVVLLDLNMPKRSGFEVIKWIREQPAFYTLPIVVLSSSAHGDDIHRAYGLHANAYLVKPSKAEKLFEMTRTLRDFWLTQNQEPPDCLSFRSNPGPGDSTQAKW